MNNLNKCFSCDCCEPGGIGFSCEPECMKYKQYCCTAIKMCNKE